MNKSDYPHNWKEISLRVRTEAGWCCEWCGAPNARYVVRIQGAALLHATKTVSIAGVEKQVPYGDWVECFGVKEPGSTKIILTVAHLDRDTRNNERSNLAALCQRCHLNHDRAAQHIPNRRYGKGHAKEQQKKLFT